MHEDKWSQQHQVSSNSLFDLHSPKPFTVVFESNTVTCFIYSTALVLGQLAVLCKEACLYTGANWLSSSVIQSVARGLFMVIYRYAGQRLSVQIAIVTLNRPPPHPLSFLRNLSSTEGYFT